MASSNTLVVAIDFGTTYSGYAYSFKSDTTNVKTVNKWSSKLDSQKTPTSVLLTPARKLHSFGYDAEEHYAELLEDDKAENWALFRRIKMVLYGEKELSEQTEIWDVTDTVNMPAMEIFSMAIKFLKDHATEAIKDPRNTGKEGKNLTESDIYFILTVPAIWDDSARLFMRKAAVRAGIPEANLGLALESEAASIWCQNIPLVVSKGQNNDLSTIGAKYMVVDIGGGTADITVHEKQSDGNLRELCWASGGDWGGTKVDEEFLRMLEGLMGKAAVERFKRECMADLFDLLRQFEMVKRTTDPKLDGKLKIRLPESLRDISRDANKSAFMNSLLKSIKAFQNEGLSVEKDKLRIDANKAREMFAYSVDGMCTKMRKILSNPKAAGVEHILVVGGFSDSPVVREALKKNFTDVFLIFPP
ncbi:heat shock 70 kDa protein 12A-like isoform X1 [Mercenaria mercenaria]|uniref:heat shock 70 kDa protein 12A-like isoform X1 n=1 Tax=Mercenaria mercenaria TaxID=6596 RepID=UPI00234F8D58|nr:heat shock 70 kDa protein 12A-like isoform X1 [Mercenaria mercenaria]XP_053378816.1 heat shock 70 kDa protein 12A-like isoform X1 [Mercenaria mercenaria]